MTAGRTGGTEVGRWDRPVVGRCGHTVVLARPSTSQVPHSRHTPHLPATHTPTAGPGRAPSHTFLQPQPRPRPAPAAAGRGAGGGRGNLPIDQLCPPATAAPRYVGGRLLH